MTPPIERTETIQLPRERRVTVTPPIARTKTLQPPRERGGTVTAPAAQREPAFVPPREAHVPQPERVQIPVPPVVGGSGVQGIFQRGPPARPANEGRTKEDQGIHRNKAADRNTRKDGGERHDMFEKQPRVELMTRQL